MEAEPSERSEHEIASKSPRHVDNSLHSNESRPAVKRFAVLAGFLVPIALIPYILMRRQTIHLRREIETLKGNIWSMEVHYSKQLGAIHKELELQQRLKPLLTDLKHDFEDFQEQAETSIKESQTRAQLIMRPLAEEIQQTKYVVALGCTQSKPLNVIAS